MMEGWEVCFFLLVLGLAYGKDIPVDSTYVVKKIDSCPDVGYFFRRDQSPNVIGSGPCYLCFCQNNRTAVCWERERERCDVEKFHHHRVGRSDLNYYRHTRTRRSPISLTDIFFRDETRNFFINTLPKQCKPFESSFSDGCPPGDWCLGCTICDCDANSRWDCRVLSFCDGKKKENDGKPRSGKRIINKNNLIAVNTTTNPAKKIFIKFLENKFINETDDQSKKNTTIKSIKLMTSQPISKPLKNKPKPKRLQPKKPLQNHPNATISKIKIIKRHIAARNPVSIQRGNIKTVLNLHPDSNDTVKMGQKIVKKVMTIVHKLVLRGIENVNKTRKVELDERKNCAEVQKRKNKSYNVKSNTAARNKTKHKGQATLKENYTFLRYKREILNEAQAKVENVNVIKLKPDDSVIPLETVKLKNSSTAILTENVTLKCTTQQDNYYKYSIKSDDNESTTIKNTKNTTESYKININVIPIEPKNNITASEKHNNETIPTMHTDFNDQSFTKSFITKIKTENRKKSFKNLLLPKPNLTLSENEFTTHKIYFENKMQKKDIETQYGSEQNWTKLVTQNYSRPLNCTRIQTFTSKTDASGLNNMYNKSDTKQKTMKPKVNIMKYVRKFFHEIFSKNKARNHKVYGIGTKEDRTLQILCEKIGPCKIKRRNKLILKYKLKQLNKETDTILRSIKIIKGLLPLLVLPGTDKKRFLNKHCYFQNDVRKLGVVLRDNYKIEEINETLLDAQMTLINNIKKNTQIFIESVKKFTNILNETLAIIRPDVVNDHSAGIRAKKLNNTIPLYKIKKMLYKYNIIQNNFMKKMYELMNEVEKKPSTTTERIKIQEIDPQRHSNVIEMYSRNIIENLRRLKTLAQVLNSKRKKRNVMTGDGPLEYMLTLMEYLIKHNQPSTTAPAKDGIDILIDAIRNAPSIKPIKKKVLYYTPVAKTVKLNADGELSKQLTEEDSDLESKDNILKEGNVVTDDSSSQVEQTTLYYVTPKSHIRVFNKKTENNELYETTSVYNYITKKRSNEVKNKTGFDKFESNISNTKAYDVFVADVEDDSFGDDTSNSTVVYKQTTDEQTTYVTNIPETTTTTEIIQRIQSNESISSESQDSPDNKKTKIDWIEETFDREIKEFSELNASYSTAKAVPNITTRTTTATNTENNISGISVEANGIPGSERVLKKLKTEDLMYQKQLQFLNSLDYGTEKSDFDDPVDSKDEVRSDDAFPAYFV